MGGQAAVFVWIVVRCYKVVTSRGLCSKLHVIDVDGEVKAKLYSHALDAAMSTHLRQHRRRRISKCVNVGSGVVIHKPCAHYMPEDQGLMSYPPLRH